MPCVCGRGVSHWQYGMGCGARGEGRRTVRSLSMSAMMYTPLLSTTNRTEVMIYSRARMCMRRAVGEGVIASVHNAAGA